MKNGAQTALDTVARDRIAHTLAYHKAKAAMGQAIGQTAHDQTGATTTASRLAHTGERVGVPQAVTAFHRMTVKGNQELVFHLAVSQLNGDMLTATQTAPFENVPSSRCLHPLAKPMGFQALTYFGLPSSLGHAIPATVMRHEPAARARPMKDSRGL